MRALLECLQDWLVRNRADGNAYSILCELTRETLKRAESQDPAQREFDAEALAAAAGRLCDYELAKRWIDRAKPELFAESRRALIEEHFRAAGHAQALRVVRRSPGGKHRAIWLLEAYTPEGDSRVPEAIAQQPSTVIADHEAAIHYDFTPPGEVKAAWYARPLFGAGSFVTRSWRGLLWVALLLVPMALLLLIALTAFGFAHERRPLQTADIASMLIAGMLAWIVWRSLLRPVTWLIDDRIALATELWVGWNEATAQLELTTDQNKKRMLQLVRYTAVCPLCAGTVELRYSQGPNRRRLLGCCSEVPHEHVFSFDRVLRTGNRLAPELLDRPG